MHLGKNSRTEQDRTGSPGGGQPATSAQKGHVLYEGTGPLTQLGSSRASVHPLQKRHWGSGPGPTSH